MEMVLKLMEVMDDDCDFGFPSIIPALLEERGRGAHPPCSSLASSIGGDRFPPLVHSVHGPRGRKPLRDLISIMIFSPFLLLS